LSPLPSVETLIPRMCIFFDKFFNAILDLSMWDKSKNALKNFSKKMHIRGIKVSTDDKIIDSILLSKKAKNYSVMNDIKNYHSIVNLGHKIISKHSKYIYLRQNTEIFT